MRSIAILLSLLISMFQSSKGQLASFDFENTTNDGIGSYHGTPNDPGYIHYETGVNGDCIRIDSAGQISFPVSLQSDFIDNSFEIELDFKYGANNIANNEFRSLLTIWKKLGPHWNSGFNIELRNISNGTYKRAIFQFGDGGSVNYHKGRDGLMHDNWMKLRLRYDGLTGDILYEIYDETFVLISVEENIVDQGYSLNEFNSVLTSFNLVLGGDIYDNCPLWVDNLKIYSPSKSYSADHYFDILQKLKDHIDQTTTYSDLELLGMFDDVKLGIEERFVEIKDSVLSFTAYFEAFNPPLFSSTNRVTIDQLPIMDQIVVYVQQWIFDHYLTEGTVNAITEGFKYEAHEIWPGSVSPIAERVNGDTVTASATFNMHPFTWSREDDFCLRPLGYYAPAGELITIQPDDALINSGASIVVGCHTADLSINPGNKMNRFLRISKEFEIGSDEFKVMNPFGGGLYLRVPDGANLGEVDLIITGAVKSPLFKNDGDEQTDFAEWKAMADLAYVPFGDFVGRNFMATVPYGHYSKFTDPKGMLEIWDSIVYKINYWHANPKELSRPEYFQIDRMNEYGYYSGGYPMAFNAVGYRGPWNNAEDGIHRVISSSTFHGTMTHEWGHIYRHVVMPMEAEAVVNIPTAYVEYEVFGLDFDHCMTTVYAKYTRDQAMWDWVTSQNFRRGHDMSVDTLPDGTVGWKMLQYQQRGYAKYIDLAEMMGWDAFREIHFEFKSRYVDEDDYVNQVTRDDYVYTASEVLNVDIRPLFHFWGIHESDTLKPYMDILPESDWIKERLYYYYSIIPTDFQAVYDANFPTNPNSPFYPVAINYFDSTWVTQMRTVTQRIMNKYFTPYAPTITDAELVGDQFQIFWEDNDTLIGDAFILAYLDESSTDTIYVDTLPKSENSYLLSVPDTSCYTILLSSTNNKGTSNWAQLTEVCNYPDLDMDGFPSNVDCNDLDSTLNPNTYWYADIDQDGFGDPDNFLQQCLEPSNFVSNSADCDDTLPDINPGQIEVPYNSFDDDCDPSTLDDDLDQDGYGIVEDCDDNNDQINPDQTEVPYNGIDDDCDDTTLDDDLDQDGFLLAEDCDDENADINPDGIEIPNNGIDEDCDGMDLINSVHELSSSSVSIYPNPTTGIINITVNGPLQFKATIYNLEGRNLFSKANQPLLQIGGLSEGVYFLEIEDLHTGWKIIERIVKMD
ncbi:MAG: M60 family metallopeptidase [Bacteroidota bacterium]